MLSSRWTTQTLVLAALASGCLAQSSAGYLVLPASEARHAVNQCSRSAPPVEGGWTPAPGDIKSLEAHLGDIAHLSSRHGGIAHPEQSFREYVGIVSGGKRLIYVNAIPASFSSEHRKILQTTRPTIVCDGGSSLWGAVYDPTSERFDQLETNGPA